MGFTLSLQRADPSPVRAAARFEADDVAIVDLWATTEGEASDHRVPRDNSIAPVVGWCVGGGSDLAQRCDGAFVGSSRGPVDRSLVEGGAPRMLSLSPAPRVFVGLEPVDLRQSFNGLSARVQSVLAQDPLSPSVFIHESESQPD
jgi:hypothetical protein